MTRGTKRRLRRRRLARECLETVSQHFRDLSVSISNIPIRSMTCNIGLLKQAFKHLDPWFPNCGSRIHSKICREETHKENLWCSRAIYTKFTKGINDIVFSLFSVSKQSQKYFCHLSHIPYTYVNKLASDSFTRRMLCNPTICPKN